MSASKKKNCLASQKLLHLCKDTVNYVCCIEEIIYNIHLQNNAQQDSKEYVYWKY